MIANYSYVSIRQHRSAPRLWLQGRLLMEAGYRPGAIFRLSPDLSTNTLTLELLSAGKQYAGDVRRVSAKGIECPIIDINCRLLADLFGKVDHVKVKFQPGKITVTIHPDDAAALERVDRLCRKIEAGDPLSLGSLFHGAGILDAALHEGIQRAGLKTSLAFAVELDQRYLETSLRNNPIWQTSTAIAVCGSVDKLDLSDLTLCDVLTAGIPCTGASLSGRAKLGTAHAEEHPDAGHLFAFFLAVVKATQPGVILFENVPPYQHTASMSVIRATLKVWGYELHETHLDGNELGALEGRRRLAAVAVTKGLAFSWADLEAVREKEARFGDVMDRTADNWSSMTYLKEKVVRDRATYKDAGHGTGFAMQIIDADSPSVPVIGREYWKVRSTEPKVRHPDNPDLLRQLTPEEHAAVKGIPFTLVAGEVPTIQHEMLGQSVVYPAFVAVGRHIGRWLRGDLQADHQQIAPAIAAAEAGVQPSRQMALF